MKHHIPTSRPSAAERRASTHGAQQMGEGSYEATRDYQENIGEYLKRANVQADAQAARPRNKGEAREMQRAEREGRSHAKADTRSDRMADKRQT